MKTNVEKISKIRDASKGLTKFFIDLALQSLDHPLEIPSLAEAPTVSRDYRKISFEGIKCAGKDYTIRLLLEQRPDLELKPKFNKTFPFKFLLDDLRNDGVFGGFADSLLLAAAYAYDEEYYAGKGKKCYVQSRGVYTFATMEVLRLEKETKLSKHCIRDFIVDVISIIGLPDIAVYLDVDLKTAIERSRERNAYKPSKQIIEGSFLEDQKKLQREYEYLLERFPLQFHRLTLLDAQKNIECITGLIDDQ